MNMYIRMNITQNICALWPWAFSNVGRDIKTGPANKVKPTAIIPLCSSFEITLSLRVISCIIPFY